MGRKLIFVMGIGLAGALLMVSLLMLAIPVSVWGVMYWIGAAVLCAGMLCAIRWRNIALGLMVTGALIVAGTMAVRIALIARTQASNAPMQMLVLPRQNETRWVNALMDEQDSVLLGEMLFYFIGGASAREHEQLAPAMQTAYASLRDTQPAFLASVVSTYLALETADAFDTVIVEPAQPAQFGVVFLHGFMGNVAVQCWEIAQAVRARGGVTVCPSTDWTGSWWKPQGENIVRATIEYLHARGITKIYFGGFSNGGFGTSRLAPELARDKTIRGLFFIAGITDGAALARTGLPILVIQGTRDERVEAASTRLVLRALPGADYVEIEGDHFLIIKQAEAVQGALGAWLEAQLQR